MPVKTADCAHDLAADLADRLPGVELDGAQTSNQTRRSRHMPDQT